MKSIVRAIVIFLIVCTFATVSRAQTPSENAWTTLNNGLTNKSWENRVKAVGVLGDLTGDSKASEAAIVALKDERTEVRMAAAQALGEMHAKGAITALMSATKDPEPTVILTAARALISLGDKRGYNAFYAVLTGETKTGTSLTDQQKKTLKDPKKMAGLGLQAGMGFVPFGGLALGGYKMLSRDDTSPVLAAAALTLAKDPDPKSSRALADAATKQEKSMVRSAVFNAIALRGDPSLLPIAVQGLQDKVEDVQYSAAGAVIRLSDIAASKPDPKRR